MKKREVPKKNYFYLLIMIVLVVIITFAIFDFAKKYSERKLQISNLDGFVNQVTLDEAKENLKEASSQMFIMFTETNNKDVYKLESDLKKLIKENDLRDNFIFVDYTENKDNINEINDMFGCSIKNIPAILYFKNGEFVKSIDSSNNILNMGDFQKLLDEYEV